MLTLNTKRLHIEITVSEKKQFLASEIDLKIFFTGFDPHMEEDEIVEVNGYGLPVWYLKAEPIFTLSHVTKRKLTSSYYEDSFKAYDERYKKDSPLSAICLEALNAVREHKQIMELLSM